MLNSNLFFGYICYKEDAYEKNFIHFGNSVICFWLR